MARGVMIAATLAAAVLFVCLPRVSDAAFNCASVAELSVTSIQTLFFQKKLTSKTLVGCYLKRIADYSNPKTFKRTLAPYAVNAILELNPMALKIAADKDNERKRKCGKAKKPGCLGMMHGIPVALKDNVAADPMNSTAGSYALLGCKFKEATLVKKLKAGGAIIIAKAGLSEWANYRGRSVSGWSGIGGQVYSSYVRYRRDNITVDPSPYPEIPSAVPNGSYTFVNNPGIVSGSSSGSGVVAALSLATVTIGSETGGSILSPSSAQAVVGLKPTVGLVSRYGVVPLSHSQDTAGPMCRTVAGTTAVYTLEYSYGVDANDVDTISQIGMTPPKGYIPHLIADGLRGKTIAATPPPATTDPLITAAYYEALQKMQDLGATVDIYSRPPPPVPIGYPLPGQNVSNNLIFPVDFKADIAQYLAGCKWDKGYTPLKTLADLIAFNKKNYLLEFQGGAGIRGDSAYGNFFQQTWESSQLTKGVYDTAYLTQKATLAAATDAIIGFFKGNNPYNRTYDVITHVGGFTGTWARSRFPSITVPLAKQVTGAPQGMYFSGLAYSEATIIEIAYGYEQKINMGKRFLPTFCDSWTC